MLSLEFGGRWKKMKLRRIVNSTLGAVALLHYFFSSWIIGTSDRKRPKAKPLQQQQQQILRSRARARGFSLRNKLPRADIRLTIITTRLREMKFENEEKINNQAFAYSLRVFCLFTANRAIFQGVVSGSGWSCGRRHELLK